MIDQADRIESVFAAVLQKPSPQERAAYLDQACAGNPVLRGRVEALLKAHDQAGSFLQDQPARPPATVDEEPITERPGTVIGPYKLMEQIGEGGMGLVFVAEQQQPVRRRVALKIIKPGMDSKQVIARFEAERQALALMDHQNIAKVFDASTTESGRPYFVMELVHGVPITDYCDANKLTPRQRLELFVPVCHALQHAHQKGIIHRDIKPSNILVTMYDDKPVPKVIDFGVAKAVEQRLTEKTVYTQFGTLVGTFEYMSPEQAEMNAFGVDTRSDVYSLGVLLYELLTGTTPLERPRLREAAFGEIVRLIKEEEPPRPSVRLSTSGALAKLAAARKTDPEKLSRLVRGELDWVVMRCLEKDRTRRYDTASSLARDVERYLRDEPVEACPPSAWYRFRKLARRNKVAFVTSSAVAAALLLGIALSTWQAVRARSERDRAIAAEKRAQSEQLNATAALDYISREILAQASPDLGADPDIKLRTVVERISENLKPGKEPPLVEASIRHTLGNIYVNLERYPEALRHFQRAYALRQQELDDKHPDTIRTMIYLGNRFLWEKDAKEGEDIAVRALTLAKEVLGPDDFWTLIAMRNVAPYHVWAKRYQEAEDLRRQFLADCIRTRGPSDTWSITAHTDLAWYYLAQARFVQRARLVQAEDHALRAVKLRREHQGEDHYLTHLAVETLANVYARQHRYAEAEALYRELVEGFRRHVGDRSLSYLYARSELGFALNRQGKHTEAVAEYEEAILIFRQVVAYRDRSARLALDLTVYGDSLNQVQRFADAEIVLREALALREKELGPNDGRRFNTQSILGETLLGLKRYEEAKSYLQDAYRGQVKRFTDDAEQFLPEDLQAPRHPLGNTPRKTPYVEYILPQLFQDTLTRLERLYEAWGKPEEAARWRKELEAAKEAAKKP